jgi:uncharacterized protein (TIGR03089 family)
MADRTPYDLLLRAVADDGARPLLTYLDDSSGERTELSVATYENWVAKTANLLVDGLALDEGARIALRLPLHWQGAVWLMAGWATGATVVPGGDPAACDVAVVPTTDAAESVATGAETLALALQPLARPGGPVPAGVTDYDVEIRAYGDRFAPRPGASPAGAGLELPGHEGSGRTLDAAGLVGAAAEATDRWRRPRRLMTGETPDTLDGVLAAVLVPLVTGGSAVLVRDLQALAPDRVERIVATERVDATVPAPGGRAGH